MRKTHLAVAVTITVLPALALAWTPYAPHLPGAPLPYPGYVGPEGSPSVAPRGSPWPVIPSGPYAGMPPVDSPIASGAIPPLPDGWFGEGARWPSTSLRSMRGHLEIRRQVRDDAYLIDISLGNLDPQRVQIRSAGRGLLITYSADMRRNQDDTLPYGAGYRSSYSVARSASSRRVALPPDANLAELSRDVADGHILVCIPRTAGYRPVPWQAQSGPSQP
jgi:hypothetical protein